MHIFTDFEKIADLQACINAIYGTAKVYMVTDSGYNYRDTRRFSGLNRLKKEAWS